VTSNRDRLTPQQDDLLRDEIFRIVTTEHPISGRALYYRCVLSAALPFITKDKEGSRRSERLVASRCLEMRRKGDLRWDWIVDPSRADYTVARYNDPAGFAEVAPLYYRRDFWQGQEKRPVVLVEKVAALSTMRAHCNASSVDIWATKGFGSATQLKDIAEAIHPHLADAQDIVFLVAADFDPSGCDWPRAAEVEVRAHLRRLGQTDGEVSFSRVLMTQQQAESLGQQVALRAPSPKETRTKKWLERFGFEPEDETCVALDALAPSQVRRMLTDRFERLFNGDLVAQQDQQERDRDLIRRALASVS